MALQRGATKLADFLTSEMKLGIVEMALDGCVREFPHKLDHVLYGKQDAQSPRALHPAFYGCYDWHSAVHSHWVLVVLMNEPAVQSRRADIESILRVHFSEAALGAELDYLLQPGRQGFERPYGWAWLWALQDALKDAASINSAVGDWHRRMVPLGEVLMDRWLSWLDRQTYPCRQGTHANTAFAMALALDHARALGDATISSQLDRHSIRLFGADVGFSLAGEPSANDFLSPSLSEAALLTRCLSVEDWVDWWEDFLPATDSLASLKPAVVSDRADAQGVHLDGLNLSRAWHAAEIAQYLKDEPSGLDWQQLARQHWEAGISHLRTGDFLGEHWLGTFALAAGMKLTRLSRQ